MYYKHLVIHGFMHVLSLSTTLKTNGIKFLMKTHASTLMVMHKHIPIIYTKHL